MYGIYLTVWIPSLSFPLQSNWNFIQTATGIVGMGFCLLIEVSVFKEVFWKGDKKFNLHNYHNSREWLLRTSFCSETWHNPGKVKRRKAQNRRKSVGSSVAAKSGRAQLNARKEKEKNANKTATNLPALYGCTTNQTEGRGASSSHFFSAAHTHKQSVIISTCFFLHFRLRPLYFSAHLYS